MSTKLLKSVPLSNADNMPTQISHSSNITTELTYGGTGERVKKRVYSGGNVTDTYYIGDHFEVKGGETIKYIFARNLRMAQVKGTTRSFFHKDHLGSSTVMTDASGYVIESTEYVPFGSQRSHSGTNTSDYKYTDQELDAENGLYNYNARLYDTFIGRFISPDTIVPDTYNPQSLNRYSYCLNNPLIYVDPSGHQEEIPPEAYAAMAEQSYNMYNIWPQMCLIMQQEFFSTGFEIGLSSWDLWNLGFEEYNAHQVWKARKKLFGEGGVAYMGSQQAQAAIAAGWDPQLLYFSYWANKGQVSGWIKELQGIVQKHQGIQDFFKCFNGFVIVEALKPENLPSYRYSNYTFNMPAAGAYQGLLWFNYITYSAYALVSKEQFMRTFIHEMAHYAEDVSTIFGRLSPNMTFPNFTPRQQTAINKRWEGPYGYVAENILFGVPKE
jgi:RHS repeat-associated protein